MTTLVAQAMPGTRRDRMAEIWRLALPIMGALSSQIVLNLIDAAMVWHLGAASLAAVGVGSFLNFTAFSALAGLSTAVQALAARRHGEGRLEQTAVPLNGGILLSLAIGLPLSAALIAAAPWVCARLSDDAEVVRLSGVYLHYRLLGVTAVGINFAFRGYWSAVKKSMLYMVTLSGMCALNVLLDYLLIYGKLGLPALGVRGAGMASTISAAAGTAAYVALAWRYARRAGFAAGLPAARELRGLLRLGLPACVQQFFFSAGFLVLFWIVGQIGTAALAVSTALVNITLAAILPAMGFGIAAATFCSQALGRGDADDAYRWGWDVFRASWWIYAALALVMLLFPQHVLGAFFGRGLAAAQLVRLGVPALRLVAAGVVLDGLGFVLMQSLLGAGASRAVMQVSIGLQWGLFLPLAYVLATRLDAGLLSVWALLVSYRATQTLIFMRLWRGRHWARIAI